MGQVAGLAYHQRDKTEIKGCKHGHEEGGKGRAEIQGKDTMG